jgi:arylsulfatase
MQVAQFMQSLQDYPPRIKSLDFDLDAMVNAASQSQAR